MILFRIMKVKMVKKIVLILAQNDLILVYSRVFGKKFKIWYNSDFDYR